ncbi:fimbrial biogenesis outer membrane usher protein [Paraburkholderia sp. MMS20-SJTR3]|uniref:Fimbrial biogenesis outer membrane usher protein n=1 Tax=Paraburkholderia sejongensis TaxID=2886946 RepID=A0ABS8K0H4_9BURK|nr:fimbria/pilus outer membrane usher protein [Paraburkholderia sp. MMS20-SJTR3]MCC8395678.1 fimbrial biogenesis outer membrane usher protein [Paraburkholderia sp. MMS20-SJTR3]
MPEAAPAVIPTGQAAPIEPPQEVEFNPAFFTGNVADLSRYTRGNPVAPGLYPLDLYVNGKKRGRFEVRFDAVADSDIAAPCFTMANLDRAGVDTSRVFERYKAAGMGDLGGAEQASQCVPLSEAVPGSTASFNTADLQLDVSIPQLELRKEAAGYVDPSRWDNGITAGFVQYSLASYASHQNSTGVDLSSVYLGLQSGFNVGGWRFRQRSTATWQNRSADARWQSVALYAQHDVTALRSQFTIGDSSTSGDVFDSFNVRGAQLSSDDRMLPDSMRSYAPVVRGVADTNARVTVRQNNIILSETSVPPGPFELSDLPATGYGGDLQVTITEADGRQRTFFVPFASVTQLLRPGISRFNVTAGVYRDTVLDKQPWVAQAVYQRGLTNLLTGYTGGQFSEGYWAGLVGVALNTPIGAFALDVTAAGVNLPGESGGSPGYSTRLSYSKMVPGLNTNFSVAAYRYSTSRFYSLRDAIYARNVAGDRSGIYDYRTRSRLQLNINQPIGESSSLFIAGSSQNYWGASKGYDLQYQLGFNSSYKRISYSLYGQRTRLQNAGMNTQVGLNLTIPLGRVDSNKSHMFDYLTTNLSHTSNGDSSIQATASGNTTGSTPINYGITASRIVSGDNRAVSGGGYATYRAPYATFNGNASVGNKTRQAAFNADGAVIIHDGGVTLSPPLGQAFALVEAKGAKGGRIINGQGARIDDNGYAVVSSLTPYRVNTVALDPSDVPLDIELGNTSEEVVPRANSLVKVKIATTQGTPLFAEVEDREGKALPMGTELFDETEKSVGIVGQGGLAYLRGLEGEGKLRVRWGNDDAQQCVMAYKVPDEDTTDTSRPTGIVARIKLSCDPTLVWSPPAKAVAKRSASSNLVSSLQ